MKIKKLTNIDFFKIFPGPRNKNTNKNDYGHVLILSGSKNFTGASILTTFGCLRVGPGLVTLGFPEGLSDRIIPRLPPEAITLILCSTKDLTLDIKSYETIKDYIIKRKINVIVIGPGIGINTRTKNLIIKLLKANFDIPFILDADALNNISTNRKFIIPEFKKNKIIITPHCGEFSRLTGFSVNEINENREKISEKFAKENNVIVVLKGFKTIVTDGYRTYINPTGNPGMAKGGSGDVLTGIIGGFLAQMLKFKKINKVSSYKTFVDCRIQKEDVLINSCILATYIHGLAADIAVKEMTELCVLPTDIINKIPDAIKYGLRSQFSTLKRS